MSTVVLFGDECGIPAALPIFERLGAGVVLVYDPLREASSEFFGTFQPSYGHVVIPHPEKARRIEFQEELKRRDVGLGLVVSYSRILWPELLEFFPFGVANIHAAKLPEYRGANVLQWEIINGETESAVTLHYIDEGIDTGPVIGSLPVSIGADDTALDVREKKRALIEPLLSKHLPLMIRGRVGAIPQDASKARYWPRRKPEDGLINWSWPDEKIRNLSRALVPPWPRAYHMDKNGERVELEKVLSLEDVEELRRNAAK